MPRSRRARFRGPADRDRTFVREGFRHHIRRFFGWVSPDRHQAMTGKGVRRDKAALSSGCEAHPAIRSSRKQPEQAWRRRNV